MATKEFILQGFTPRTHVDAVRQLFDVDDIQRVVLSVAFVSDSGVQQIEAKLKANAKRVTVFAGVRNDITSHQGLLRLHGITGSTIYTVDTGSRSVLFHPKLYLVRGKKRVRMIVGSANLTLGGLNNNIEAGMLLDCDLSHASDKALVDAIEAQLAALPVAHPSNVEAISSVKQLDVMLSNGRLVDEMATRPPRPNKAVGAAGATDTIPRIKLKVVPIKKAVTKAAASPKAKPASKSSAAASGAMAPAYEPVWQSKPLSRRSLTIPSGANSHPTGSTTLGKGLLDTIDPVTYFRKTIFGHLPWAKYTNRAGHPAERVDSQFDLILKGTLVGTFTMTLRHSLTRQAAAATDKNLPTELSWNDARQFIVRDDLIDRTMTLYRDKNDPKHFAIEID